MRIVFPFFLCKLILRFIFKDLSPDVAKNLFLFHKPHDLLGNDDVYEGKVDIFLFVNCAVNHNYKILVFTGIEKHKRF